MDKTLYKTFFELQNNHWWFKVKKKIVINHISLFFAKKSKKNVNVLDIGCGSGLMLKALKRFGKLYGMDASNDAINFSRTLKAGVIKKGSLPKNLPFSKESFDLIIALDVIEHIEEDGKALNSINFLMKKNGILVLTVPALMSLWSQFDEVNHHKRRYRKSELTHKLKAANFQILRISYFNFFLFPMIYIYRKATVFLKKEEVSDLKMPSKTINFILEKIFLIESYFLSVVNFPIGVSIIAVVKKK
jgi:2-polyprenyl-3-methyl-5-hydroxy-6-metoxy-1,4-benzoquinol methylase